VKLSRLLKTRVLNVLIGCLMAGALLVACGGGDNTANTNATAGAPSADKIGVPECDDYIAKYEACINSKVPENLRATYKGAFDSARKAWRDAAATPQGKAGLATACKAAQDNAKTTLSSFGCSW
jgi:hypothetical protein